MAFIFSFIFVFLLLVLYSNRFMTLADQMLLYGSFLGRSSVFTIVCIAATLTLALIVFKAKKPTKKGTASVSLDETLRCFSYDEILSATQNFSRSSFIGYRGFGKVYAGIIGEVTVAIKRLPYRFLNQIKALSKLRHVNLVSLIGYCNESPDIILVYECMPLRTLASISTSLSWEQRLQICNGAARGLDYLQTDEGVIHGDLNSSNILLDENYKPRLSDFGLTNSTSRKKDVCSFGVVLLEVLCGKTSASSSDQPIPWARSLIGDPHIGQKVDPRINGQISPECLKEFVRISKKCLHEDPKMRPTMTQVVAKLELLLKNHNAEPETRESTDRNTRSMFGNGLIQQSYNRYEYDMATWNFSNLNILCDGYNGTYRVYSGAYYISGCTTSSFIVYRGMYTPHDISKLNEISHLRHPNLASMVGYCFIGGEAVVGYKNDGHTILYQHLLHSNLPWPRRLHICIGTAGALTCLHSANIIHGGINPTVVVLDRSLSATLATFTSFVSAARPLSLPLDVSGYTNLTAKSDVYMFGLLLLVVFCGNKINPAGGYPILLPYYIREAINKGTLYYATDMRLTDIAVECLNKFIGVAFWCLESDQADRPSMDTVLQCLKEAQDLQTPTGAGSWLKSMRKPYNRNAFP